MKMYFTKNVKIEEYNEKQLLYDEIISFKPV